MSAETWRWVPNSDPSKFQLSTAIDRGHLRHLVCTEERPCPYSHIESEFYIMVWTKESADIDSVRKICVFYEWEEAVLAHFKICRAVSVGRRITVTYTTSDRIKVKVLQL